MQLVTYDREYLITEQNNVFILYARFICATVLHLSLLDEIHTGLDHMKYALNHPYYF